MSVQHNETSLKEQRGAGMQVLRFTVCGQNICTESPDRLVVEGSRRYVYADFSLDAEWDGLTVYALFENDRRWGGPVKCLLTGEPVEVPPEVLVRGRLRVGLVGLCDGGEMRLTTRRMREAIPVHQCGGTGGEDAKDVTPELWEQALSSIGPMDALQTLDRANLVAAINELKRSGGGSGMSFTTDETLKLENGVLGVNTADSAERDNTLPITSAAVHTTVGNIEILLATI